MPILTDKLTPIYVWCAVKLLELVVCWNIIHTRFSIQTLPQSFLVILRLVSVSLNRRHYHFLINASCRPYFCRATRDIRIVHGVIIASYLANWSCWGTTVDITAGIVLSGRFQKLLLEWTCTVDIVDVQCVPYELGIILEFTLAKPFMRVVYVDSLSLHFSCFSGG